MSTTLTQPPRTKHTHLQKLISRLAPPDQKRLQRRAIELERHRREIDRLMREKP